MREKRLLLDMVILSDFTECPRPAAADASLAAVLPLLALVAVSPEQRVFEEENPSHLFLAACGCEDGFLGCLNKESFQGVSMEACRRPVVGPLLNSCRSHQYFSTQLFAIEKSLGEVLAVLARREVLDDT